jgi:hypothetical protein
VIIARIYTRNLSIQDSLISTRHFISNVSDAETAVADATSFEISTDRKRGARRARPTRRRPPRWPDFRGIDLRNENDLFTAHQLLVAFGHATDCFDDLRHVVIAAVMALRLATQNPNGYFAHLLRNGLQHDVTDQDHAAAKRVLRTIDGY